MIKLFLRFIGVVFGLYGGLLYLDPQYLIDLLELGGGSAARIEVRAMYGGLQLGVGVLMLLAAQKDQLFQKFACVVLIAIFAGLSSARAAGLIIDGIDSYNLYACIFEVSSLLVAILCHNKLQASIQRQ